jgi:hypothetical protein
MLLCIRFLIVASLSATAAEALRIYPHQLAYFNELAGGPAGGHTHLLGSNLDWGQDLLFIKDWYRSYGTDLPLYFLHYKYGNPGDYGLPVGSPQIVHGSAGESDGLLAGFHVVSINCLCGDEVYFVDSDGRRRITSRRDVAPYLSLQPVFKAGYSLRVFAVVPDEGP